MTTLAEMRARIMDQTMRDDLADAIGKEILSAIKFYQGRRFWFTEKDAVVIFPTVAGQSDYGAAADVHVPNLVRIDSIGVTRDGHFRALRLADQLTMERWLGDASGLSGDPSYYSYYGQRLRLYARPDGAYPVQIAGVIRIAPPVTDDEADNAWMVDADELIRSRASSKIYANWMGDLAQAQVARDQEAEALQNLIVETSSRTQVDTLVSSDL